MVRYSVSQPWHFGFTLSQYYETLSEEQKRKVMLPNIALKELDELYEFTLRIPPARKVVLEELVKLAYGPYNPGILLPCLVVSHAKPLTEFDLPESVSEMTINALARNGIVHQFTGKSRPNGEVVFAAYNQEIMQTYFELLTKFESKNITKEEMDLINGIFYGYPIGDVFSMTFEFKFPDDISKLYHPKGLHHVVFAPGWSKQWRREVGMKGLEHLSRVYFELITNWPSIDDSPLSYVLAPRHFIRDPVLSKQRAQ